MDSFKHSSNRKCCSVANRQDCKQAMYTHLAPWSKVNNVFVIWVCTEESRMFHDGAVGEKGGGLRSKKIGEAEEHTQLICGYQQRTGMLDHQF